MITVERLTKRYGSFTAVDDVSFTARAGQVTGFLGPNGAGKTTTMRILAGLTHADSGTATIGGHRLHDIPNPGRHVGILLDASAQHAGRTGCEVLTLAAKTMGLPMSRVDESLAAVGLDEAESRRRLRNYSLGMRQRLGIAHALLGEPSVLILDEPANGLDPAGIRWMRGLLQGYANRGGAVLLSSHLLHEVEQIADELVVIGRGSIVASGTKAELLALAGAFVRSRDDNRLAGALRARGITATPAGSSAESNGGFPNGGSPVGTGLVVDADPGAIGDAALAAGVALVELRSSGSGGLEDLFLQLTADTQREGAYA